MKTFTLLSALLLSVSINVQANPTQGADGLYIADATQVNEMTKKAKRHNFTSRRAAKSRAVDNKDAYNANDEWVGATYVDEGNIKAKNRVNRQFRSRRGHTNYQFD